MYLMLVGGGEYAKNIAMKYPQLMIDAYDIKNYKSWDYKPKNVNFMQKDLLKLKQENYYNLIYSIDVLEHIKENKKVLENIYRALEPGGYFYLHMPAKKQVRILPEKFFKNFENWAKEEHIGEMYKLEELNEIVSYIGFEIVESRETFSRFGSFAWEIDRITDKHIILKILLMPLLKLFGYLDIWFLGKGNGILIISTKKVRRVCQ